jgi:hypothetical protein
MKALLILISSTGALAMASSALAQHPGWELQNFGQRIRNTTQEKVECVAYVQWFTKSGNEKRSLPFLFKLGPGRSMGAAKLFATDVRTKDLVADAHSAVSPASAKQQAKLMSTNAINFAPTFVRPFCNPDDQPSKRAISGLDPARFRDRAEQSQAVSGNPAKALEPSHAVPLPVGTQSLQRAHAVGSES